MKVCPNCSSVVGNNTDICSHCGYQLSNDLGIDLNQTVGNAGIQGSKYCRNCGSENPSNTTVCFNCGNSAFSANPRQIEKPAGVVILAFLGILGSLMDLFIGYILLAVPIVGLFFITAGSLFLISSISLFTGKNWARILVMVFSVIMLISVPIGTILGIIFLYYFTRPHVKRYFERENLNPL